MKFDDLIRQEQNYFESKYYDHAQTEPLPPHHLAHLHVLRGYSDHLLLLLHHNSATNLSVGETFNQTSQQRCLEAAKRLLESLDVLHGSQEFAPFRWYNNGLGSFYAFHAAVVLIAMRPENSTEVRVMVERCLTRFKAMSNISPLCNKAAPLLEQLLECFPSSTPQLHGRSQGSETPWAHQHLHTPSSSLANGTDGTNNSDGLDWDSIWPQFQAEQWVTPTYAPWDQWNSLFNAPMLAAT